MCIAQIPLWADSTPVDFQDRINEHEAKIKTTNQRIVESEHAMAKLVREEAPIIVEIEGLNFQLNGLHRRARAVRSRLDGLNQELTATTEKRNLLEKEIRELENVAAKRLVAFYKLCRLGIVPFLFSDASFFETQQRIHFLETILDQDAQAWETLQSKRAQLGSLVEEINIQSQKQALLMARYDKEATDITKKRAQRAALLEKIRTEKALTQAAVEALRRSVGELDEKIQSLRKDDAFVNKTRISGPFLAQKGILPMPVQGNIVAFFGPYQHHGPYDVKGFKNGVNIEAQPGAGVHAVWDGHVIYSDWFKGYGNIVIIDHGAQYYTLCAQLDQVLKRPGDQVDGGDMVGTVGDTATHGGLGLYFEIRHQGKPLDPVLWFRN